MPENKNQDTEEKKYLDKEKNRDVAAFSYFLILSPVLLFTRKDSEFIQFHAKQATLLFVAGIIFALLPTPLSYANFLILSLALTGLIQANMGKYWKIPIISNILESGFSADTVWEFLVNTTHTIKRVFTSSPGASIRAASNAVAKARGIDENKLQAEIAEQKKEVEDSKHQIEFLERELLIEKYLKKTRFDQIPIEIQKAINELKKQITANFPEKTTEEGGPYAIRIINCKSEVVIGGYNEKTVGVFFTGKKIEGAQHFGRFSGFSIDPTNESQVKKIIEIVKGGEK